MTASLLTRRSLLASVGAAAKDRPIIFSAPMVQALLAGRKTQTRRLVKVQIYDHVNPQFSQLQAVREGRSWRIYGGEPASDQFKVPYAVGDRLWVKEGWQVARETLDYETGGEHDVFEWAAEDYGDPRPYLKGDARFGVCAGLFYKADGEEKNPSVFYPLTGLRGDVLRPAEIEWRTPLFMPRWASRLTLIVTDVRVERLQEISEADAVAEGIGAYHQSDAVLGHDKRCAEWVRSSIQAAAQRGEPKPSTATNIGAFRMLLNDIHGSAAWAANPWVAAISFEVHRANIDALPDAPRAGSEGTR